MAHYDGYLNETVFGLEEIDSEIGWGRLMGSKKSIACARRTNVTRSWPRSVTPVATATAAPLLRARRWTRRPVFSRPDLASPECSRSTKSSTDGRLGIRGVSTIFRPATPAH